MKSKRNVFLLLFLTLIWMAVIGFLSTQNGEQTARTSYVLAEYISKFVYREPSTQQLALVHTHLRTLAHVFLFFVFGAMGFVTMSLALDIFCKSPRWVACLSAVGLVVSYGFFDEWRKQFILGRHFDLGEAGLNIVCGLAGIAAVLFFVWVRGRYEIGRSNKKV